MSDDSQYAPLNRGKACLPCRSRKTKCDGLRPICSQCSRSGRQHACEFSDSKQHYQTEVLEENLTLLRNRLEQLKNPHKGSDAVFLHDPYAAHKAKLHAASSHPARAREFAGELQPRLMDLMGTFFQHHESLGFAMHPTRFMQRMSLRLSDAKYPHGSLIAVIRLWGLRLTGNNQYHNFEETYQVACWEALENAVTAITSTNPSQSLDTIQAEILYAQYCFSMGQILEGRYHSNSAVTLAISCGLHQLGKGEMSSKIRLTSLPLAASMEEAQDWVEYGERVRTFWSACKIDSCWNSALGQPLALISGTQINVPWPQELAAYETPSFSRESLRFPSDNVFRAFLRDTDIPGASNEQVFDRITLNAAALFVHASYLTSQWYSNPHERRQAQIGINGELRALGQRIRQFGLSLNPVSELKADNERHLGIMMAHAFGHSAMMSIHQTLAATTHSQEIKGINAALSHVNDFTTIVEKFAEATGKGFVADPILSILGGTAGSIIMMEIQRLEMSSTSHETVPRQSALKSLLKRLLDGLTRCSGLETRSPVFLIQIDVLEDSEIWND